MIPSRAKPLLSALALLGAVGLIRLFWGAILTQPLDQLSVDLYPSWLAVRLYEAGQFDAIYHPALWIAGQEHPAWAALMKQNHILRGDGTSFVYGPTWLLLVAPILRSISLAAASKGMLLLNAAAVVVIAAESARLAQRDSLKWTLSLSAIFALSLPVLGAVWLGQNTLVALALGLLGARLLLRQDLGGEVGAAVLWTLAATAKPWFVAVLAIPFAMKRWRALGLAAGAWAVATLALPALFVPESVRAGYAAVASKLLTITVVPWNDVSIRVHLTRLFWPEWPRYALVWAPIEVPPWLLGIEIVIVGSLALFGLLWAWRLRPPPEVVVALGLAAVLLPLGVCWTHYLALGLPLAVVALGRKDLRRGARWAGLAALAVSVLGQTHVLPTLLHRAREVGYYQEQAWAHPNLTAHLIETPMYALLGLMIAVVLAVRPSSTLTPEENQTTTRTRWTRLLSFRHRAD